MQTQIFLTLCSFHSTLLPCLSCALVRKEESVVNLSTIMRQDSCHPSCRTQAQRGPLETLLLPLAFHKSQIGDEGRKREERQGKKVRRCMVRGGRQAVQVGNQPNWNKELCPPTSTPNRSPPITFTLDPCLHSMVPEPLVLESLGDSC